MATSRIAELADNIATNTSKLNGYLVANGLPSPSFDIDGPSDTLVPKNELDIEAARVAIIDDTQELRRLVLGPREYLMSYTASFSDIAAASSLNETNVQQFIRHAIVKDIFVEPRPGFVAHNAVSRLLAEDQVIYDWVGASTDDLWQGAAQTCNALEKFPGSQESNETGFALANQTDRNIYEEFSQFPSRARRFGNAMRSFTEGTGFELSHVVENFSWGEVKDGMVVDVGGSQGFACMAIAHKFPSLSFVVQDLEAVIVGAQEQVPPELASRIKYMGHDFLTEQPIKGADVYFFRWILHNWSDKYCIKILQSLIPALKPGAKIVLNDNVLPKPGVLSRWQENRLRSMDLTMTEIQNSHERELGAWAKLFKLADPRFEFQWGRQPAGANLWLMVAEWKPS